MEWLRDRVDAWYLKHRDRIFERTRDNPSQAHRKAARVAQYIDALHLGNLLLRCPENSSQPSVRIANAAGLNKNAEIPLAIMAALGFDVSVIGTVTGDRWSGNAEPNVRRYVDTNSMVNWQGLPGIGAQGVAHALADQGRPLHVRYSVMATPGKQGDDEIADIKHTVQTLYLPGMGDSWELNISCPNTKEDRSTLQRSLDAKLSMIANSNARASAWYIKLSPDGDTDYYRDILDVASGYDFVKGFVCFNTTTQHDERYIPESPGKGGASGHALYDLVKSKQEMVTGMIRVHHPDKGWEIVAVGGIDCVGRAKERIAIGRDEARVSEIQLYTGLIYNGPDLVRKLRRGLS